MNITPRDKKFLITGAVAVGIFIVMKFGAFPLYDQVSDQRNDIFMKEKILGKYLNILKKQDELQQTLKHLTQKKNKNEESLLQGETPSLAAADIQKLIDSIAKKSEVQIQSVKVIDPGQKAEFITIPVQVMFTSDLSRTGNFIRSIENNQKLLTIPELKIRVKNKRKTREVVVTLQIMGFMKKEEAAG